MDNLCHRPFAKQLTMESARLARLTSSKRRAFLRSSTSPQSTKQHFQRQNRAEVNPFSSGAAEVAAFVKTLLT